MSIPIYSPFNRIVHETYVDFIDRYIGKPVHVVQGDHELPVVAVKLYSNGVVKSINQILQAATSSEINIRCRDKKGNQIYASALGINAEGTIIFFEVTDKMTKVPGDTKIVLEIKCDDQIAQSSIVMLDVDRNPIESTENPPDVGGFTTISNYTTESINIVSGIVEIVDYILEEAD